MQTILGFSLNEALPIPTFVISFVSGIIPVVNVELYLLAISPFVKNPTQSVVLGLWAGLGQMLAKSLLFFATEATLKLSVVKKAKESDRLDRVLKKMQGSPARLGSIVFLSGVLGLPPFLLVAFVAGLIQMNFWLFFATGLVGRCIRFIILMVSPGLILNLFQR